MTRAELANNGDLRVVAEARPNGALDLTLEERVAFTDGTGPDDWCPVWSGMVGLVSSAPASAHAMRTLHLVARELLYQRSLARAAAARRMTA